MVGFFERFILSKSELYELAAPFQLWLIKPEISSPNPTQSTVNVVYIARNVSQVLSIDMEEAHRLVAEMSQMGVSMAGTWANEECTQLARKLQLLDISCRAIPAPTDDGGIITGEVKDDSLIEARAAREEEARGLPHIYDAYARRMEPTAWARFDLFQAHFASMKDMCLVQFSISYRVPRKDEYYAGKIHPRAKPIKPRFSPEYSSEKENEHYGKYCHHALVKYRPWIGDPFQKVGEDNPTEQEMIQQWEDFVPSLSENKLMLSMPRALIPPEMANKEEITDKNEDMDMDEVSYEEDATSSGEKQNSFLIGSMIYSYIPSNDSKADALLTETKITNHNEDIWRPTERKNNLVISSSLFADSDSDSIASSIMYGLHGNCLQSQSSF